MDSACTITYKRVYYVQIIITIIDYVTIIEIWTEIQDGRQNPRWRPKSLGSIDQNFSLVLCADIL